MTARQIDSNGWFSVARNPISRVGVFPYLGRSLGLTGEDAEKVFQVYRPAAEIGSDEAVASFRTLPIILDHTMLGDASKGYTPATKKGVGGTTGDNVEFDPEDGILYSNLKIFDEGLAEKINNGTNQLSCGYRCEYDFTSGTFDGKPYDVVQRKPRGNHVAVVKKGRMGSDIAVLDSDDDEYTFDHMDVLELKPVLDDETKEAIGAYVRDEVKKFMDELRDEPKEKIEEKAEVEIEDKAKAADKLKLEEEAKLKESEDKSDKATMKAAADAMDAAIKRLEATAKASPKIALAMAADRDDLYNRVKPFVGVFPVAAMDADEVAVYAAEKLGLKVEASNARAALDGYLHNRSTQKAQVVTGLDSADTSGADLVNAAFL